MKEGLLRLVRSTISNPSTLWRKEKNTLGLYDSLNNLPVKIFFEILGKRDLNLLNPKRKRVKRQRLQSLWEKLREDYYKSSNPEQYKADLKKAIRVEKLKIEIACCTAAVYYFELTLEILPEFKEFGYIVENAKDVAKVKQKMLVRKTRLTMLTDTRKKNDKQEAIDFWDMVSDVQSAMNQLGILSGEIDIDKTMTAKWISYIKRIKKENGKRRENNKK